MRNTWKCAVAAVAAVAAGIAAAAPSGEEQAARQARSVHLQWMGLPTNAVEVAGTLKVIEEQTNSYFMAIGFDGGYMGLQNFMGYHIGLFSVWDPVGDPRDLTAKADDVEAPLQAKVSYAAKDVVVSRFGGEGTGAKTMFGCDWKIGQEVHFRVTAEADGADRTLYTCYIGDGECEAKIASISRLSHGRPPAITRVHSFVEDFWRNGLSKSLVRRAEYTGFRARAEGGEFKSAVSAFFSADNNTLTTIDAGPVAGGGFLQTGGDTVNSHAPLWSVFSVN